MAFSVPGFKLRDYVFQESVKWLSHVIGVQNITRPFWNRWRASHVGEATIMEFLGRIKKLDDWVIEAKAIIAEKEAEYDRLASTMSTQEKVDALRRLSFISYMGQWGAVELDDTKRDLYRRCRDHYVAAETLAYGARYKRGEFSWKGRNYHANIHYPSTGEAPFPGVLIIHGMDSGKEEHLMTELAACEAGLAVCCIDGPGQGEALLLDGNLYPEDFADFAVEVIGQLAENYDFDRTRIGLAGISWGGFWVFKIAAKLPSVGAIYDLGGPTKWKEWYYSLPYMLKSRFCQILGVSEASEIDARDAAYSLSVDDLAHVNAPVRMIHGAKDPILATADKEWLRDTLVGLGKPDIELVIYPDGDHCCTGSIEEIRRDAAEFFRLKLTAAPQ